MRRRRSPIVLALIIVAAVVALAHVWRLPGAVAPVAYSTPSAVGSGAGRIDRRFVTPPDEAHRHAASLVELRDGRVRAFWWEGSREGARDVSIRTALFDPAGERWTDHAIVADRATVQSGVGRFVRKLGNAVAGYSGDGVLRLFFVSVSVGGWGGSAINMIASTDDGQSWSTPQRLVTSPFLNISTLVRAAPYPHADGSLALPAYHEFLGKFAEVIRLDARGAVIDKHRLSRGDLALQPTMLAGSAQQIVALMRNGSSARPRQVVRATSADGGVHWSKPDQVPLPNSDAPVTGVALADGRLAVVLNRLEAGRHALSLVVSADGGSTWREVHQFENQSAASAARPGAERYRKLVAELVTEQAGPAAAALADTSVKQMCRDNVCDFEFSYPFLIRTSGGEFHLVYTWNRSQIRAVRFDHAWLERVARERSGQ